MSNPLISNPFQIFDERLTRIEHLLLDLKSTDPKAEFSISEIGGINLACELTGLAKPTVYSLVSERKIPHSKRGKKLYFSRRELIKWIESGRRKTITELAADADHLPAKN